MTTTTEPIKISHEVARAIFGSIKLNNIESFDDERDPEVYSTNINLDVTIEGETYPIMFQRDTDGDVERAPWESCGMADVYIAILKLTGEYNGEDADDVKAMFEDHSPSLVHQNYRLGLAIVNVAAMVAEGAQNEYDETHNINAILNSVVAVSTKENVITFNVVIRDRTFSVPVHCTAAGNTRIDVEWDAPFYRRLRRVLNCEDLKVGRSIDIIDGFLHDAARETMAARRQRAA